MCCGSGALGAAVALRVPGIELHAADLEPAAVACARDNLAALGASVHSGDLFAALPVGLRGRIDVLLANVPYVRTAHIPLLPAEARLHEPMLSLDGGADGLDVFRAVVAAAADWLAPGGVLLSETTDAQTAAASAAVDAAGLRAELVHDDDLEATAVLGHRSPNAAPRAVPEVDRLR
jgi:release factor glutamine methyltransferase